MREVEDGLGGARPSKESGSEGEVVVLEQNDAVGVRRFERSAREASVDGFVGARPGGQFLGSEAVYAELVPETMHGEPQHAVGGDIVVAGVAVGVDVQELHGVTELRLE